MRVEHRTCGRNFVRPVRFDPIRFAWESMHKIAMPQSLEPQQVGPKSRGNSRNWNVSPEKLHKRPW